MTNDAFPVIETVEEEHDFAAGVKAATSEVGVTVKPDKLIAAQTSAREWLRDCTAKQEAGERVSDGDRKRDCG